MNSAPTFAATIEADIVAAGFASTDAMSTFKSVHVPAWQYLNKKMETEPTVLSPVKESQGQEAPDTARHAQVRLKNEARFAIALFSIFDGIKRSDLRCKCCAGGDKRGRCDGAAFPDAGAMRPSAPASRTPGQPITHVTVFSLCCPLPPTCAHAASVRVVF